MRKYREFKKLAWENAAAMVRNADLSLLYGDDIEDEEMDAASKAQRDVAEMIGRRGLRASAETSATRGNE